MGSMVGGVISILYVIGVVVYILLEIQLMGTGQNDLIKQTLLTNSPDSENGVQTIDISKMVFMPYFHLKQLENPDELNIWKDRKRGIFDVDKINQIVEFVAIQRSRIDGVDRFRLETFRAC